MPKFLNYHYKISERSQRIFVSFYVYDINGFFEWIDVVSYAGRKLNKDGNKMKDKFISGLPSNIFQSPAAAATCWACSLMQLFMMSDVG
mgnify:CR=1 FL=1